MICPNNLHCFPVLECNIQDLVRDEIEKEGLAGVDGFSVDEHGDSISDNVNIEEDNEEEETDDVPEIIEKIVYDANDPKRHNFWKVRVYVFQVKCLCSILSLNGLIISNEQPLFDCLCKPYTNRCYNLLSFSS